MLEWPYMHTTIFAYLRFGFLLMAASLAALAQRPTSVELSASALQAEIGPVEARARDNRLEESRTFLSERLRLAPGETRSVTLVFTHGMTAEELSQFVHDHKLEISRAEAKIPAGDEGLVYTLSIGSKDLLFLEGTVQERLERAIGHQRVEFHGMASRASGVEARHLSEVAHAPDIRYFKVESIGKTSAYEPLISDPQILAVLPDVSDAKVRDYERMKELVARMKTNMPPPIRRKASDGPPSGAPFVPSNTPTAQDPR